MSASRGMGKTEARVGCRRDRSRRSSDAVGRIVSRGHFEILTMSCRVGEAKVRTGRRAFKRAVERVWKLVEWSEELRHWSIPRNVSRSKMARMSGSVHSLQRAARAASGRARPGTRGGSWWKTGEPDSCGPRSDVTPHRRFRLESAEGTVLYADCSPQVVTC